MKVESKLIAKCFEEVKLLLDGIDDVIQMGEDIEGNFQYIAGNIKQVINVFTIENMTPIVKQKEHSFLASHVELHDKGNSGEPMTPFENTELFKARLYLFLKRELKNVEIPLGLDQYQISKYLTEHVVYGSRYESYLYTDFDRPALHLIDLVAKEIIEHRRKNPQMALDLSEKVKPKSSKLIDII